MEKIKYLIIFSLLVTLGLIFTQYNNHKDLTKTLIKENNKLDAQNRNFKNTVYELNKQIKQLEETKKQQNETIISLEENLAKERLKLKDINFTIESSHNLDTNTIPLLNDINKTTDDTTIEPSITLDEKNKAIEGFEIKYKQKF